MGYSLRVYVLCEKIYYSPNAWHWTVKGNGGFVASASIGAGLFSFPCCLLPSPALWCFCFAFYALCPACRFLLCLLSFLCDTALSHPYVSLCHCIFLFCFLIDWAECFWFVRFLWSFALECFLLLVVHVLLFCSFAHLDLCCSLLFHSTHVFIQGEFFPSWLERMLAASTLIRIDKV